MTFVRQTGHLRDRCTVCVCFHAPYCTQPQQFPHSAPIEHPKLGAFCQRSGRSLFVRRRRCGSRQLSFLKLAPHDLAGRILRQRFHKLYNTWCLVGADLCSRPINDILFSQSAMCSLTDDHGFDGFPTVQIISTNHTDLLNSWMLEHQGLKLCGPDLIPRGIDHALQAIHDEEISVLISISQIAGSQEPHPVNRNECLFGRFLMAPVAAKYLWTMNNDFALLSDSYRSAGLNVDHARINADEWNAQAL